VRAGWRREVRAVGGRRVRAGREGGEGESVMVSLEVYVGIL
jgi:hypothetical protein